MGTHTMSLGYEECPKCGEEELHIVEVYDSSEDREYTEEDCENCDYYNEVEE